MLEYVRMCDAVGVPLSRPVPVLKLAHEGRLEIAKRSRSLLASLAAGVKVYASLIVTAVAGVPEIFGATFDGGGVWLRGLIEMRNGPTERVSRPSETLIVMS